MTVVKGLPPDIIETIGLLSQRLSILERGIRPMAALSGETLKTHTISAGSEYTAGSILLEWDDTNVKANPKAKPIFEIYVDNDNNAAYLFPNGASLTTALRNFRFEFYQDLIDQDANPYRNKFLYYLKNLDSSQHTYYIHIKFIYLATNSAVTLT